MLSTKERSSYEMPVAGVVKVLPKPDVLPQYRNHPGIDVPYKGALSRVLVERIRSDDSKPHTVWKQCEHYMRTYSPDDCSPPSFDWSTRTTSDIGHWSGTAPSKLIPQLIANYGDQPIGLYPLNVDRDDGGFVPPPPGLSALVHKSLQTMLPHVNSELSILNSAIELKDFASLKSTISDMYNVLRKSTFKRWRFKRPAKTKLTDAYRAIRQTFGKEDGPTLRELVHAGNDGFLQTQFNILPLLSDISGIKKALDRVKKVSNNLIHNEGKRRLKHYKMLFSSPLLGLQPDAKTPGAIVDPESYGDPVNGPRVYGGHLLGFYIESNSVSYYAEFHAQMEYNYHFSRYQREHAKLLTLYDMLGINIVNPAVLWNALPWTFVIDWAVNVSSWLDDRKVMQMGPKINISRYMWSWKIRRHRRYSFYSYQSAANCPSNVRTYLPNVYEEAYRRDVGIPYHDSLITSGISLKELSLGLSLATTLTKRQTRAWRSHATLKS